MHYAAKPGTCIFLVTDAHSLKGVCIPPRIFFFESQPCTVDLAPLHHHCRPTLHPDGACHKEPLLPQVLPYGVSTEVCETFICNARVHFLFS